MDINELNKTQLVLLTLLITFVVSIATGIVTVSLMEQAPKSVPQTINNVIERTIEKVSSQPTTPIPAATDPKGVLGSSNAAVVSVYGAPDPAVVPTTSTDIAKELGQGVIISDMGLILVDSTILPDREVYTVMLNKTTFDATVLKKFTNGFSILKISSQTQTQPQATTPLPITQAAKQ
jgi:hypothetical protein